MLLLFCYVHFFIDSDVLKEAILERFLFVAPKLNFLVLEIHVGSCALVLTGCKN